MEKNDLTMMLKDASKGNSRAQDEVYRNFYAEIKKLAIAKMSGENSNHTLQPTALVNEAYIKLINVNQIEWNDRRHFLAMAATIMRQILIDHARGKTADKRGGESGKVAFEEEYHSDISTDSESLLALNEALEALAEKDDRKAKIVELKYFGGYSVEEIADLLSISTPTVKRDWAMAKSWLFKTLKGDE